MSRTRHLVRREEMSRTRHLVRREEMSRTHHGGARAPLRANYPIRQVLRVRKTHAQTAR